MTVFFLIEKMQTKNGFDLIFGLNLEKKMVKLNEISHFFKKAVRN